jgi:hypothetical protein
LDIVNRATGKVDVDVFVRCEGTIFLFTPITRRAKEWIDENVQPDARWLGNALTVEWRYAGEARSGNTRRGIGSFVR